MTERRIFTGTSQFPIFRKNRTVYVDNRPAPGVKNAEKMARVFGILGK